MRFLEYGMGSLEVLRGTKDISLMCQKANVERYAIHGGAAFILHLIYRTGSCKFLTRDIDVISNKRYRCFCLF